MFRGGDPSWKRFLSKNLFSPSADQVNKTVVVRFIVETDGKTSHIQILSAPDDPAFGDETIRVIKKSSGYWVAAVSFGKHVRAYKTVSIDY